MKQKLLTLCLTAALCVASTGAALADTQVPVTIPAFPVTLNGLTIEQADNRYPSLVYQDITYVPMTYYDAQLLGLVSDWTAENSLTIQKAPFVPDQATAQQRYVPYKDTTANVASNTALRPSFAITVNGKQIDNTKEEYPLLVFRDVTYFPLTWRFAVEEFGWSYTFDAQNGLVITPTPTPVTPDSTVSISQPTDISTVTVSGTNVNLRSGAGTGYTIVGQAGKGDILTIQGSGNDTDGKLWYQVQIDSGNAWIASWLTTTANTTSDSTGVHTVLNLQPLRQDGKKTVIALKNGAGNTYTIEKVNGTQLQLLLDNVSLGNQTSAQGNGFAITITEAGDHQARVTVDYALGSYAAITQEDDWLTLNGYHTDTGLAGRTIVLDPGHGGSDPGGYVDGAPINDAEVGYAVAVRLRTLLEQAGATVVMTREDLPHNQKVVMADRIAMNNQLEPDIFISIHGNKAGTGVTKATGAETYTYDGKIYSQQFLAVNLAEHIRDGLKASTNQKSVTKTKNLYVLRMNNHPAVLVECGYLDNPSDLQRLASADYQQKLAEGIYQGVIAYFAQFTATS